MGPTGDLRVLGPVARCGTCRQRLGPPPWTLELLTAVTATVLVWSGMTGMVLAAYLWWAAMSIVLAFVDLAVQRLPTRLNHAAAGGLLTLLLLDAGLHQTWGPWLRAVCSTGLVAGVLAACALALPAKVHWGDVRYALAMGAAAGWIGWLALYTAAFLATLAAATVGTGLILCRGASLRTQLSQGPFMFGGALTAIALLVVGSHDR